MKRFILSIAFLVSVCFSESSETSFLFLPPFEFSVLGNPTKTVTTPDYIFKFYIIIDRSINDTIVNTAPYYYNRTIPVANQVKFKWLDSYQPIAKYNGKWYIVGEDTLYVLKSKMYAETKIKIPFNMNTNILQYKILRNGLYVDASGIYIIRRYHYQLSAGVANLADDYYRPNIVKISHDLKTITVGDQNSIDRLPSFNKEVQMISHCKISGSTLNAYGYNYLKRDGATIPVWVINTSTLSTTEGTYTASTTSVTNHIKRLKTSPKNEPNIFLLNGKICRNYSKSFEVSKNIRVIKNH